jgi:NRAMP (natural resistance-associated macrophage protein)-like metal ion transporter
MAVSYLDPGNLEADLQQGFKAGYALGWVIVWSTAVGWVVQQLSVTLGVATGKNLAEHCKEVYPKVPTTILWLMTEIALLGSDIQEVAGSAIAIQLLSIVPIPLWVGVLLTGELYHELYHLVPALSHKYFRFHWNKLAVKGMWTISTTSLGRKSILDGQ